MAKYKLKDEEKSGLPYWTSDYITISNYDKLLKGEVVEIKNLNHQLIEFLDKVDDVNPTESNTKAEIQAYLDSKGISYTQAMNKTQLLELLND